MRISHFTVHVTELSKKKHPDCPCGYELQTSDHVLWVCPLMSKARETLQLSLEIESGGPLRHHLVATKVNLLAFESFA